MQGAGFLLALAVVALVLFVFVRFALAFPAIAVDAPGSLVDQFKYSFMATKGRFSKLMSVYLVTYLILVLVLFLIVMVFGVIVAGLGAAGSASIVLVWLSVFLQGTLQFIGLAVFASIASQAFLAWSGWQPPAVPTAPTPSTP